MKKGMSGNRTVMDRITWGVGTEESDLNDLLAAGEYWSLTTASRSSGETGETIRDCACKHSPRYQPPVISEFSTNGRHL